MIQRINLALLSLGRPCLYFCLAIILAFTSHRLPTYALQSSDSVSERSPDDLHVPLGRSYATIDPEQSIALPGNVHVLEKNDTLIHYSALARGFYFNDQRIQFTGQEATFGAEAVFTGAFTRQINGWQVGLQSEIFITQPYDDNILLDTPERVSFAANFDEDPFEISELFIEARRGNLAISAGRRYTPFGRVYFPLDTNRLFDAPFIRTESIQFRETGLRLDYTPGPWEFSAALVNGTEDLDTNSSKALVSRIGYNGDWFAIGGSVKWQDGNGSEGQKLRNNHVGLDAVVTRGRWSFSGEVIYDEYGFRRPFDPLDIRFGRSVYNREQFFPGGLRGVGYYVNLNYFGDRWSTTLNYGEFIPGVQTGDVIHDVTTRRGYIKLVRHFGGGLDFINTVIVENDVPVAQANRIRKGLVVYTGLEYRF